MKHDVTSLFQTKKRYVSTERMTLTVFILGFLLPLQSNAEFNLNFDLQSSANSVGGWANQSCNVGGGGMGGMGGMGRLGPGCGSDYFRQEVINDNGTEYYRVVVIDRTEDFALEYYMRTGGCCWWGGGGGGMGGGGMGGMGGGGTPYSSSYGTNTVNDRLANAWKPLATAADSGNGTGNPARVYMRQTNNDGQMNQEFLKDREIMKPRITQDISDGSVQLTFDLDMSNGSYANFTAPSLFNNTFTLSGFGGADFDMTNNAPQANVTAGQFIYTDGNGDGGSNGTYSYAGGDFDVYAVDWLAYCDPSQNSDHNCNFSRGGGGGMGGMGGGGGGGR